MSTPSSPSVPAPHEAEEVEINESRRLPVAEGRVQRPTSRTPATPGGKAGRKNFTAADISVLLDFVEEVEPLGMNEWALVATKYNEWAMCNERPERAFDSIKEKFKKLSYVNKSTGDPSCPPVVRRAKRIAHSIMGRASAACLGGLIDDDHSGSGVSAETGESPQGAASSQATQGAAQSIGRRVDRRGAGAGGVPRAGRPNAENDRLLNCVEKMVDKVGVMSDAIAGSASQELENIAREQVSAVLLQTNKSIDELKSIVQSLASSFSK